MSHHVLKAKFNILDYVHSGMIDNSMVCFLNMSLNYITAHLQPEHLCVGLVPARKNVMGPCGYTTAVISEMSH